MQKSPTIILSTGGTAGHIFPAVACAEALVDKGCSVTLLTNTKEREWQCCKQGVSVAYIESGSLSVRKGLRNFSSLIHIVKGFFHARRRLKKAGANVVVGFGSYATVPVLLATMSLRIPIVLHEQNAVAGKANRLFSRTAIKVATAFKNPMGIKHHMCVHTGNPVRKSIRNIGKTYTAPKDTPYTILVTGGSQGAAIFGDTVPRALVKYAHKIRVIQQTKKAQVSAVKTFYKNHKISATVVPFIADMASALKQADLAIGRSGAGSVTENACVGIASILVPYKHAAHNHQLYNAKALENAGAAFIIKQDDFTEETLQNYLDTLLVSDGGILLEQMARNARTVFVENAEEKTAQLIYDIATKSQERYG